MKLSQVWKGVKAYLFETDPWPPHKMVRLDRDGSVQVTPEYMTHLVRKVANGY